MKLRDAAVDFLSSQGNFDFALTINLKKRHPKYLTYINPEIAQKTGVWFLKALNREIFKRGYRYGHSRVKSILCIEKGVLEQRTHLHIAIEKPSQISQQIFTEKIYLVYEKMDWRYGEIHVEPYFSNGWIYYLLKNGLDSIVFEKNI